jgi:hypothetical protein
VTLPRWADSERIEASYRHGVLELTVPRREESKPRRIELKLGREDNEPKAIEAGPGTTSAPKADERSGHTAKPVRHSLRLGVGYI